MDLLDQNQNYLKNILLLTIRLYATGRDTKAKRDEKKQTKNPHGVPSTKSH